MPVVEREERSTLCTLKLPEIAEDCEEGEGETDTGDILSDTADGDLENTLT